MCENCEHCDCDCNDCEPTAFKEYTKGMCEAEKTKLAIANLPEDVKKALWKTYLKNSTWQDRLSYTYRRTGESEYDRRRSNSR